MHGAAAIGRSESAHTMRNNVVRLVGIARRWQCRLPGRPPWARPMASSIDRRRSVLWAYRSANTDPCSTNVLRGHSGYPGRPRQADLLDASGERSVWMT